MAFPDPETLTVPVLDAISMAPPAGVGKPVVETINSLELAPPLTAQMTLPIVDAIRVLPTSSGGSGGSCEDDRPETGMLYPRG